MGRVWALMVGWLAVVATVPAQAQPAPSFRIVFEGDTRGASSGGAQRTMARHIFDDAIEAGAEISIAASDLGVLYEHGRYLLPAEPGQRLSDALAVLDGSPLERLESVDLPVLRDRYSINLLDPLSLLTGEEPPPHLRAMVQSEIGRPGRFADVVQEQWSLTRVRSAAGREGLLLESPHGRARPLSTEPDRWEPRFRYDMDMRWSSGEASNLISVARRIGEGTRRLHWVQQQLGARVSAIFVSAGNSLEGRSWLEGVRLNLQRPTTWEALAFVGLDLLVPAETELAGGVEHLRQEAARAGVRLVSANLFAQEGDTPIFEGSVVRELGGLRVAFVGLTDPDVTNALPPDVIAETRFGPPAEALAAQLASLRASPDGPPDFVVLLTVMDTPSLEQTLARVPGVDLVIGRGGTGSQRDTETTLRVPPGSSPSEVDLSARTPLLRALTGEEVVGRVDVYAHGANVTDLRLTRRVVDQDWAPMSPFIEQISTLRHRLYVEGETPLFPDLNEFLRDHPDLTEVYLRHANIPVGMTGDQYLAQFPVFFGRGIWLHYLANTVREWTGTDVALVRVLPQPFVLSGPIPQILVDASVGVLDEVVVYRLGGEELSNLLAVRQTLRLRPGELNADHPPPAASGVTWDAEDERYGVGGRDIDSDARYTVAMTDQLAAQPDYAAVLADHPPRALFRVDSANRELDADDEGQPQSLHGLAIDDLVLRAEADADFGPAYIASLVPALSYQGDELSPELIFRIRALDFSVQQVSARGDRSGYTAVRNTRVTQAESFALQYVGDLDWVFDLVPLILTFSFESEYGQLQTEGATSETADDLIARADIQLRLGGVSFARSLRPYLTVAYDTEFTPVEVPNDAGGITTLDRESLLRNSAGLRADFNDIVPELRLGGLAQTDFAANPVTNRFGFELLLRQVWEIDPLVEQLDVEGFYYVPSDADTLSDLRFSVRARLFVGVPIIGKLHLAAFVDAFVFQGTEPTNSNVAATVIFGAGLSYRDVFRWAL